MEVNSSHSAVKKEQKKTSDRRARQMTWGLRLLKRVSELDNEQENKSVD